MRLNCCAPFSHFLVQGFLLHLDGAMNRMEEEIKTKDKTCQQLGELVSQLREKLDRAERQSSINSKRVGRDGTEHVHPLPSLVDHRTKDDTDSIFFTRTLGAGTNRNEKATCPSTFKHQIFHRECVCLCVWCVRWNDSETLVQLVHDCSV